MTFTDEQILSTLPDVESAQRFLTRFEEKHARDFKTLTTNRSRSLLSDVLAIVSFSDFLAATLLENPGYLSWLDKRRRDSGVRSKEELLESCAQFRSTNMSLEANALYEKFRRRELLRIFLRDIRRLATIAEITEEISNLADSILESAIATACAEVDNRFGRPQEEDAKGKARSASFCIVALGKLGSRELNYSSDIDLLFLYSGEGKTRGGSRKSVTNREYFVKLAELIIKLIGQNTAAPSAYRVDMRLRPHGSLGALAMSVEDTALYYENDARPWERQVLIRSRAAAGEAPLFTRLINRAERLVFSSDVTPAQALEGIREAKEKIDRKNASGSAYDVKLGRGGIREIEFLAQGLQLAYGGRDKWLRAPHTLISLSRLAEHKHISSQELSELSSAYDFLRRTEHVIQMENGLQTHVLPTSAEKLALLASRMKFAGYNDFDSSLRLHTKNVREIFDRVTEKRGESPSSATSESFIESPEPFISASEPFTSATKPFTGVQKPFTSSQKPFTSAPKPFTGVQKPFTSSQKPFASAQKLFAGAPESLLETLEFRTTFAERLKDAKNFAEELSTIRKVYSEENSKIRAADIAGQISITGSKSLQTQLAEASIEAARNLAISKVGLKGTFNALALGKLGSRTMDYGSDLDLVIVYDGEKTKETGEKHSRTVETFVNVLSSITRDGNLYRVDLRLRPHGSKGMIATPGEAFLRYLREEAATWEFLAFVKLRGLGEAESYARFLEREARKIIHERAAQLPVDELRNETFRVRTALEESHTSARRTGDVDIKYGAGGMLDIYFATRFLQLRDDVRDDDGDRSTAATLDRLREKRSLPAESHAGLIAAYDFLSRLDHSLRLTIGRTRSLLAVNPAALTKTARDMGLGSADDLKEQLSLHRLRTREIFDDLMAH